MQLIIDTLFFCCWILIHYRKQGLAVSHWISQDFNNVERFKHRDLIRSGVDIMPMWLTFLPRFIGESTFCQVSWYSVSRQILVILVSYNINIGLWNHSVGWTGAEEFGKPICQMLIKSWRYNPRSYRPSKGSLSALCHRAWLKGANGVSGLGFLAPPWPPMWVTRGEPALTSTHHPLDAHYDSVVMNEPQLSSYLDSPW
jgi:hypothetical protein